MARQQFKSAQELLPGILLRLARDKGDAQSLQPVWAACVGEVSARNSRVLYLEGRTLIIEVPSPRWSQALQAEAAGILERLARSLGEGAVDRLVFRAVEPR